MTNPLAADLDRILAQTQGLWEELRGSRLFITGGTGFIGCWLLESFVWACDTLDLNAQAVVLSRDPDAFGRKAPHIAGHPAVRLVHGDIRTFPFPQGRFSHVIHAATDASAGLNAAQPLLMLDTIVSGTRRALEFSISCSAKKFLLTSSGLVYGKQPSEMSHLAEDYTGAPDTADPASTYAEGKRVAELLCSLYGQQAGLETKIARCFAFAGPYLPLGRHFAIGNFIRDALTGGPIRVNGDGTPYRSYLYAADLAIWLWTVLLRGQGSRPYNIGSDEALTISQVAHIVRDVIRPGAPVVIAKEARPGTPCDRYVPSTRRARAELQLQQTANLREAIRRTALWHKQLALTGTGTPETP